MSREARRIDDPEGGAATDEEPSEEVDRLLIDVPAGWDGGGRRALSDVRPAALRRTSHPPFV